MTSGPDDWGRVRPLLERLFELPQADQASELARVRSQDPALADRVASLVRRDQSDPEFLEPIPAPEDPARADGQLAGAALGAGDLVGPWRLLSPLGAGGMGEVWLGERADGSFEKRVAIKLLRFALVSPLQRARFARERALLAGLEHPSIARLLDGGALDDGRPWLAMEHVDGLPIDQAADAAELSVRERLEWFGAVCQAVAAAHAALVVHRDLKPDNVLVGADGRPVLLDFGVAKVLDTSDGPAAEVTHAAERAFTPSYASPEQLLGRAVGTASDVYSLGALLYELLTARRPHDLTGASPTEIVRRVTERAPPAPSTVAPRPRQRALQGDLDTIVAKAMHAEPARRYESARALADDVQRHLDGLPVHARPDELAYRVGRFVTRHALAVSAAGVIALLLVVSLVVITGLLWETRDARDEAQAGWSAASERERTLASLARSLVFEVYDAVEHLQGASAARTALLALSVGALDGLADQAEPSLESTLALAQAYQRLGDLQGRPGASSALDLASAADSYQQVIDLLDGLPEPRDAGTDVLRAEALGKRAAVELRRGQRGDAAASLDEAADELAELDDPSVEAALELRQAEYWQSSGQSARALAACQRAQELLDASDRVDLGVLKLRQLLAWRRGQLLRAQRDLTGALASLTRATHMAQAVSEAFPADGQALRVYGLALGELGSLFVDSGRLDDASEPLERQLALFEQLALAGPDDVVAQLDLALAHEKRAERSAAKGLFQSALDDRLRARELDAGLVSAGQGGMVAVDRAGHDELLISDAEYALGWTDAALASAQRAIEILSPLHAADPAHAPRGGDLLVAWLRVGEVHLASERHDEALTAFEHGQELAGELVAVDPLHGAVRRLDMVACYFRAVCHQALGRDEDRATEDRVEDLGRAAGLYAEAQARSAELSARGMLQPGDEGMDEVVEQERQACESERLALLPGDGP
jgi:tetratricopeptide (TPR) repeat protein/tRNA A-37 threonylcarbamoyl transferase component Bud32